MGKVNYVTMRHKVDMRLALVLLVLGLISHCHGDQKENPDEYFSRFVADLWLEGADIMRIIWRDCSKKLVDVKDIIDHKEYFPKFVRCMKRKTLRALDRSLSPDVVPVADGVNLVRFEMVDRSGNIMLDNETSSWTEQELDEGDWRTLALRRMAKVLRTHVIKFDFEDGKTLEKGRQPNRRVWRASWAHFVGPSSPSTSSKPNLWTSGCPELQCLLRSQYEVEYRGRRRHQMMTMMMFGVVSIGMVLIPMGFQFLAVLGGKALLLAKMALILASIQGLKKIAASPVNYGFYHSFPPYPEHFERRSQDDWPPPSVMPGTPPPTMPISPWSLEASNVKVDRIHIADKARNLESADVSWKPELPKAVKKEAEPRLYPIYAGLPQTSPEIFTAIDAPTPLTDLTTRPGEVQADFALDLPYNGFRFQSPTTVIQS